MLLSLPAIQAEEGWIDGIKVRWGNLRNRTSIYLPSQNTEESFINKNDTFSHLNATPIFPIAIVLPETLMNSWSFRGAVFEFQSETGDKDLSPRPDDSSINSDTTHWRQKSTIRKLLYNDFFTDSDKSFADANSKWALSADVEGSRYFFGYNWGVFIPLGKYQRFLKIGIGPAIYYTDLSIKLNLCSKYKITVSEDGHPNHGGECVGKTEIDSASIRKWGFSYNFHATFWERFSQDSIWKIVSWSNTYVTNDLKLKNHNDLKYRITSGTEIFISYTYRF